MKTKHVEQPDGASAPVMREIFPTMIAQHLLTPSPEDVALMHGYMTRYESASRKSAGTPDELVLSTGDTTGFGAIHAAPEFRWLTQELETLLYQYVENQGFDSGSFAMFHQKSWPVVTRQTGGVANHAHENAQVSAVFYLRCEPEKGGELVFESPNPPIIAGEIDGQSARKRSRGLFGIRPMPHMAIMFPSYLRHRVLEYSGTKSRWSVSYDFTVTARRDMGAGHTENMVVHPANWVEIAPR